jgi:hypothetical protein
MKYQNPLFTLLIFLFFCSSCASSKQKSWLKAHQTALREATGSNMSAEAKMDILLSRYTTLMDEGLRFVNPVKGVKYITKFQKQNENYIAQLASASGNWMNTLNTEQTLMLGLRTAQKPYVGQFINLLPRFKRKYEQYRMVAELTNKVTSGLGKIGSSVLKL